MLDVLGLEKGFGSHQLFAGLNWRLDETARVGLIGPNGVGKTTLLRILAGLDKADGGTLHRGKDTSVGYLEQEVPRDRDLPLLEHVLDGVPEVRRLEAELTSLEQRIADHTQGDITALVTAHHDCQEAFNAAGGPRLRADAREILVGLGFSPGQFDTPLKHFSGGYAMRAQLARLLVARPSLLLLDEPNNHLDLPSLTWFETFLQRYEGGWVLISHDRTFLDRAVKQIAQLTPSGVQLFWGNYSDYLEQHAAAVEQWQKKTEQHEKRVAQEQRFVDRFRAKASKARQAQSRLKQIEKQQAAHDDEKSRHQHLEQTHRRVNLRLPEPPRAGEWVCHLKKVAKRFKEPLYSDLNLSVRRGEKIALVGANGGGKSTLLKLLAGTLEPDAGQRELGANVETFYFAQHQIDALTPSDNVLESLQRHLPIELHGRARNILGAFLFSEDDVEKKVAVLSGGEKSRLALARMMAQPYNFLLLDEPTNHLDLESCAVLEEALRAYTGTIVFVSHDRHFVNALATHVIEVDHGKIDRFIGNYDAYRWKKDKSATPETKPQDTSAETPTTSPSDYQTRKAARRKQAQYEKALSQAEAEVHALESQIATLDRQMHDPAIAHDLEKLTQLAQEKEHAEKELETRYESWLTLQDNAPQPTEN